MVTVTCAACGAVCPAGQKFCGECAAPLPRICPACGAGVGSTQKFCGECGAPLMPAPAAHTAGPAALSIPPSLGLNSATRPPAPTPPALPPEERRLITALFCDLVGFTPLSERLDPEEVRAFQTDYFGAMDAQIERYGGTVEKYAGDAVLALFGTPIAHEDDAERAVLCALGMQTAMDPVARRAGARWAVEPAIRIGVNTGEVIAGSWEAPGRQEMAVTGDAVNTAARLQTAADPGEVLVGAETMRLTRRRIRYGDRREVVLKGKAGVVPIWPALGLREEVGERWEGYRTPLIGRDRERAVLLESWMRAQGGDGQLVTVIGDAGVGKSRLVAEVVDTMVSSGGVRTVRARCLSYGQEVSLWLVADLLRSLFEVKEQDGPDRIVSKLAPAVRNLLGDTETAAEALDVLGEVLGLPPGASPVAHAGPQIRRQSLVRSVRAVLGALAGRAPVALLLEDLHWIDDASREVLAEALSDVPGLGMLVVAAQRPGWTAPWSEWGWPERLTLRPLGGADAALLAGAVLGGMTLSPELEQYVADRAGGNPLFVEEMLRALQETGGLEERAGVLGIKPEAVERLPSTLTEVLLARLDRLEAQVRNVVQVASVIGRSFAVQLLAEVAGRERLALELPLSALQRAEIAFPRRAPDLEYVFKHVSMRDVAYNTLVSRRRKELHLRTARAIAALYPSDEYVEMIAHHYARTDAPEAAGWLERAGDRAAAIYASAAAVANFEEARRRLAAVDPVASDLSRLDEKLASVLFTAGRYDEVIPLLERVIEAYRGMNDLEGAGRATALLGQTHRRWGTADEGIALVEPMVELLAGPGSSPAVAALHIALAHLYFLGGRYREMLAAAEAGGAIARAMGDDRLLGEAEMRRGTALDALGQTEEAYRVLERALPLTERGGDLNTVFITLNNLAVIAERLGRMEQVSRHLEASIAVVERLGNLVLHCFTLGNLGNSLTTVGAWKEARVVLDRGIELGGKLGRMPDISPPFHLGLLLVWQGEWEEALPYLKATLAVSEETEDRQSRELAQAVLAELEVLEGRPEEAVARLTPLVAEDDGELGELLPRLAWAHAALGGEEHLRQAGETAARAVEYAADKPGLLVYALWARGMALARLRQSDEAEGVLNEGLALARALPFPYLEGRILTQLGLLYKEREQPAEAGARLEEALAVFRHLGARKDIEAVQTEVSRL